MNQVITQPDGVKLLCATDSTSPRRISRIEWRGKMDDDDDAMSASWKHDFLSL